MANMNTVSLVLQAGILVEGKDVELEKLRTYLDSKSIFLACKTISTASSNVNGLLFQSSSAFENIHAHKKLTVHSCMCIYAGTQL